ncbi:MAG: GatB/YqeY domain-containing protein [Deltaproteobacteria bacterium]|nr:GatB/YqeY domain-containing protein [Deltaproteobacteria bacterium]
MSSLNERLEQAFKEALKSQQAVALSTLRMLKTAVRHKEVELKRPLAEDELQAVISNQAKQRREAMAEYAKAGRPDLAKKEEEELQVLLSFLPPQLNPEACEAELARIIQEVGASGPKDLGKVMKAAMARLAGQADGKVIQEIAKRRLSA